jgi:hypothetical protein
MDDHEELLAKASECLSEASKIQDPEVRAKVLELVYYAQRVAAAALAREVNGLMGLAPVSSRRQPRSH